MSIGLTLVCLVLKFGEKTKMNSKKVKKMKYFAVTVAILMLTSILLTVNPVQAQVVDQGGENPSTPGGSIPLPAGVTPDLSYQTIAYISFRPNPIGVNQPLLINVWLETTNKRSTILHKSLPSNLNQARRNNRLSTIDIILRRHNLVHGLQCKPSRQLAD